MAWPIGQPDRFGPGVHGVILEHRAVDRGAYKSGACTEPTLPWRDRGLAFLLCILSVRN